MLQKPPTHASRKRYNDKDKNAKKFGSVGVSDREADNNM